MPVKIPEEPQYIRVGDNYYKLIKKVNSKGISIDSWQKILRQTLMDDHDKKYLWKIPKYDAWCVVPNHNKYNPIIHSNYNMYNPFIHKQKRGSVKWTMRLLRHVFGEQIDIGLDYLQLLYEKPTQILPILCLVSFENQTGKTTFLDWMNEFFRTNMAIIGNVDIAEDWNAHYATKLLIAIDESRIDKVHTLEKIKSMATAKTIFINDKFISKYQVDFFGKLILCSNHEDNFITAKDEDVRYWVRKLTKPRFKNVDIIKDLINEIPAFLYYIKNRKMKNEKESRMWFDPDILYTDALGEIRANSTETVIKHLMEICTDVFDESGEDVLFATPSDVKNHIFKSNSRIDPSYIRRLLKNKFGLNPAKKVVRYSPLEQSEWDPDAKETVKITKTGRPFALKKEAFYLNGDVVEDNEKIKKLVEKQTDEYLELPF